MRSGCLVYPGGGQRDALAVLAARFGDRVVGLIVAVTNPADEPDRDDHEQYREHVTASLRARPWARIIKASDFTDNAVGLIHTHSCQPCEQLRGQGSANANPA